MGRRGEELGDGDGRKVSVAQALKDGGDGTGGLGEGVHQHDAAGPCLQSADRDHA